MSVFGNGKISPDDCDSTTSSDIEKIPPTPDQADSISDVSEPLQGPPHTSNVKISP